MKMMQEKQTRAEAAPMRERMEKQFAQWLQENGYEEAAFLAKYRGEELVLQYVIGEEQSRIYLADDLGGQAEVLCEFPTDRIGESRDLYGAKHNRLRKLPESADCGLAANMRREYEGLCCKGWV